MIKKLQSNIAKASTDNLIFDWKPQGQGESLKKLKNV